MVLDTGTLFAITIALVGSCGVMALFFRRVFLLERTLLEKNRMIIKLQGQLEKVDQ
jgi:hypothetical protein